MEFSGVLIELMLQINLLSNHLIYYKKITFFYILESFKSEKSIVTFNNNFVKQNNKLNIKYYDKSYKFTLMQ